MRVRRGHVLVVIVIAALGLVAGCRDGITEPPPSAGEVCFWIEGQYICIPG